MLAASWPQYMPAKDAGLVVPGGPQVYWLFDSFVRQGMLWFLSDGQPI